MSREGCEELLLDVADGVCGHLDGVDALVRQAGVEHLALHLQLPLRRARSACEHMIGMCMNSWRRFL